MNEYTSFVENGRYELRFTTDNWATFREIEDKMREIIDQSRQPHPEPMCWGVSAGSIAVGSLTKGQTGKVAPDYPMKDDK